MAKNDSNAPPKGKKPIRMNIKIDDAVAKGVYSNNAVVHNNDNEFVLDFLFAEPTRPQGHVVSRIVTNPKVAKRLAKGLTQLVERYEKKVGEIKLPNTPTVEPESYH